MSSKLIKVKAKKFAFYCAVSAASPFAFLSGKAIVYALALKPRAKILMQAC